MYCSNKHQRCYLKRSTLCAQNLPGLLRQKAYRKRTAGRLRWQFPGGFQLAVALYALVQPATRGGPTFLNANTNQPLQVESAMVCLDTGARVGHNSADPLCACQPSGFCRYDGLQGAFGLPNQAARPTRVDCEGGRGRVYSRHACPSGLPSLPAPGCAHSCMKMRRGR